MGDLDVDDLDWDLAKRKYNAMKQYSNTKLMNVVYANELTRRFKVSPLSGRPVGPPWFHDQPRAHRKPSTDTPHRTPINRTPAS